MVNLINYSKVITFSLVRLSITLYSNLVSIFISNN